MLAEDAEQIACIGLLKAACGFRPERGFQFSTYATWSIKRVCLRYGPETVLLIRVPAPVFWACFQQGIEVERFRQVGGLSAVRDQLAELEIVKPWLAERWRAYLRARNLGTLSDRDLLREAHAIPDSTARPPFDPLLRGVVRPSQYFTA